MVCSRRLSFSPDAGPRIFTLATHHHSPAHAVLHTLSHTPLFTSHATSTTETHTERQECFTPIPSCTSLLASARTIPPLPSGWSHGLPAARWDSSQSLTHQICLTAHHEGGFALWPSNYTDYSVKRALNWRNGTGDVLREFADAANRWGIKICYYLNVSTHKREKSQSEAAAG